MSLLFVTTVTLVIVPRGKVLHSPVGRAIVPSPFVGNVIPLVVLFFFIISLTCNVTAHAVQHRTSLPRLVVRPVGRVTKFVIVIFPLTRFITVFG